MKKKVVVFAILILAAVLLVFYVVSRPESLGNMKRQFFLYDSDGNVVYELDRAKALETYYIFNKTDRYTLVAEYSDFVGNYKITVYKMEW